MRVSLRWLEEFVQVDVPPGKLAELLNLSGTKVEAIHRLDEGIKGVVVAEVKDIKEHPNADNLILVDASVGEGDIHHVVCGARNFSVGDLVPYAKVGARLPAVGLQITERKIRGQTSQGMLCSAAELGISKDHSGILVLPSDSPLNQDVAAVLGLDDIVFEFEITPNRPDCMSVVGIAREVSVLLDNELKVPEVNLAADSTLASPVVVSIEDPQRCTRYLARYIDDVRIGSSPGWMAARLLACGVRPISNVVDATNYVMLELGQPLHAFDAAKVQDQKIVVRTARKGERLVTLDGVERRLQPTDLLITDPKKALAIAGVMGGGDSEVTDETSDVILESAHFDPVSISLTARRELLRTEASARFERGMDPEIVPVAAARAAQLIAEAAGARVSDDVTDEYPSPPGPRTIRLRPDRTAALLGAGLAAEVQTRYLTSLGLTVTESNGVLEADVPTFRPDLLREEDLIEEVARISGFERLPATLPPGKTGGLDAVQSFERKLRRTLTGLGLHEAWTSSMTNVSELDALGLPPEHPTRRMVHLANPMSEEEKALRTTLLPGLLRSVARNVAQHAESIALFEIAHVYEPSDDDLPLEPTLLGAVFAGYKSLQSWATSVKEWDFFAAKGVIEAALDANGFEATTFETVEGPPFHPTRAARVLLGGAPIGSLGELHPEICDRFDVPERTVYAELALAPLVAALPGREHVEELARYPAVYLDVALVVDDSVPSAQVEATLREAGAPELVSLRLFDLYRGEQIEPGKKSLAYALELRVEDRTLTDEEANAVRDRMVTALQERVDATLRA